jgi:hypothetical protein
MSKYHPPMTIDGLPVVDAKKPVTIKIGQPDILKGNTRDPAACAAAVACKRIMHAKKARVHLGRTYVLMGKKWLRFMTPMSLRTEIVSFDRGAKFAAGTYVLSPPQPSMRMGKRTGSDKDKRKGGAKRRAPHHILTGLRAHGANR